MTPEDGQAEALALLRADRWRAHEVIFRARHPQASAPAHRELVERIYARDPRVLLICFRGFGKTTYTEESIVLEACFRDFRNKLIVGASYDRACERLAAVKRIIEQNEYLAQVFGELRGPVWQEGKIVLATGACIQALGRDQSLRGTKYLDTRPDSATIDDIEDKDEVLTPRGREKTWMWFQAEFKPALDHPETTRIRVLATIQHEDSFAVRLAKEPDWTTFTVPIEHVDAQGERQATWGGKFPLEAIDNMRRGYRSNMAVWEREYLCNPAAVSQQDFAAEMIRVVDREPSYDAIYAMYDPARTTRASSATTGKAVWSWRGNRLVIWAGGGERWKPDEIIADIFATTEQFDPVLVGVEEDGLNEFILQPLRHEMARRGMLIPLRPMRAPKGKFDFIRALQPYFAAGEVEFARPLPELTAQLLSFPTGDIDGPNALAYALLMKPGAAIYPEFRDDDHVVRDLPVAPWRPLYLAANAKDGIVAAALVQVVDGQVRVLADWVMEGRPEERVPDIAMEAALVGDPAARRQGAAARGLAALKAPLPAPRSGRRPAVWSVPSWHYDRFLNVGLVQAVQRLPAAAQRGGGEEAGRAYLRDCLGRMARDRPVVQVAGEARWTLRALAGGYCRGVRRSGLVSDEAEAGPYRVLMEGIEALLGALSLGTADEDGEEAEQNYSYNRHGQRYKSAMPMRR